MIGQGRLSGLALGMAAVSVSSVLTSCGRGREAETRGTIAVIGGKMMQIEDTEKDKVCTEAFCEPNYVYTVNFGRSRPTQPSRPTPAPVPVPTQTPVPAQPYETLDYSREILRVPDAWNLTVGADDVVVAVVDTGVDYNHVDLKNNIWANQRELTGRSGVDDDGNGYVDDVYGWDFVNNRPNGMDDNKHGTHCAGIIGAEKNGIGMIGINQKVKIMPLKFLDAQGSGDTLAAIRAIDYAVANGARVISNSWGGGGFSSLLNDAIQRAHARGIYVVAAAGNEANNNDARATYPAGYAGVVSVASTDQYDQLSYFSNFGAASVFIAAPGSSIVSTVPGSRYEALSGTSMATPQVSGALALGLSMGRSAGKDQVLSSLCSSSRKILTGKTGCGRMDVAQFVRQVSQF